jgi:CRISPR system Cascade subunit CasE
MRWDDQLRWLIQQGARQGFFVEAATLSQEQLLIGRTNYGQRIHVYSVRFDGLLRVTEPSLLRDAIRQGIGHGKSMGLGLFSLAPAP